MLKDHKSPFRLLSKKKKVRDADISTASADSKFLGESVVSTQERTSSSSPDFTPSLDAVPRLEYKNGNGTPLLNIGESDISNAMWTRYRLPNSPFPRYRHAASLISNEEDEIFVMGGLKGGLVFGDTWTISPTLDSSGNISGYEARIIDVANLNNPPARVGHAAVLCGNAFIVYGGDTVDTDFNGFPDNNFYLFNTSNCKYTIPDHILNKPNGRYGHKVSVVLLTPTSLRLYLFGGQLEDLVFNELYYFELNSFKSPLASWELANPVNNFKPPAITNHTMLVYKNCLYAFGGVYNNERVSNDLWCYTPSENKWLQITTNGSLPPPVNEHAACVVNDYMYVYGGNDFNGTIFDILYVLDFATFTWHKIESSPTGPGARCGHSITFLPRHNKVVVMGGNRSDLIDIDSISADNTENDKGVSAGTIIYELDVGAVTRSLKEISSQMEESVTASPNMKAKLVQTIPDKSSMGTAAFGAQNSTLTGKDLVKSITEYEDDELERDSNKVSPSKKVGLKARNGNTIRLAHTKASIGNHPSSPQDMNQSTLASIHANEADNNATTLIPSSNSPKGDFSTPTEINDNANNIELKNLILALKKELDQLKVTAVKQMEVASTKIRSMQQALEESRKSAVCQEQGLESRSKPHSEVQPIQDCAVSVSPLEESVWSTYTLENQNLYLRAQNAELERQLAEVRPFMEQLMNEAGRLERLFAQQEEKHAVLASRLVDQHVLKSEAAQWKTKYEQATEECETLKSLYSSNENSSTSTQLAQLVSSWKAASECLSTRAENGSQSELESLRKRVEEVTAAGEESALRAAEEMAALKELVESKDAALKNHEVNYREALQSVKSTSKALKINEDAMASQKALLQKLARENNELRLYKKARQSSSRQGSRNALPTLVSTSLLSGHSPEECSTFSENQNSSDNDSDDADISRAHYNMRLKELEADAYILKTERDLLKDKVAELEKQQYLMNASCEE